MREGGWRGGGGSIHERRERGSRSFRGVVSEVRVTHELELLSGFLFAIFPGEGG